MAIIEKRIPVKFGKGKIVVSNHSDIDRFLFVKTENGSVMALLSKDEVKRLIRALTTIL